MGRFSLEKTMGLCQSDQIVTEANPPESRPDGVPENYQENALKIEEPASQKQSKVQFTDPEHIGDDETLEPEAVEYDELTNLALVIHNEFRAKHTDTEPLVIDSQVT